MDREFHFLIFVSIIIASVPMSTRKQFILGAIILLLTAWFSTGYNHFDEHFQVVEFAGLKLGLTEKANLPWEYNCQMRPAVQPLFVFLIYKTVALTGFRDPFFIAFLLRLFSGGISFLSIFLVYQFYSRKLPNDKLRYILLFLSLFLWFSVYNSVRFSSETIAGRIFLIGLAVFLLKEKPSLLTYLATGVLLGLSFIIRYQMAFMILGAAAWLLIIRRSAIREFLCFSGGIILMIFAGILIDHWFYGDWVLTTWNYFQQNVLQGKAAAFGVQPWYYYLTETFNSAIPPFSLVYILAVVIYIWFNPKDILSWAILPFLLGHFAIAHKEIRFIFPVIGFLPVMITGSIGIIEEKRGKEFIEKRWVKWITYAFVFTNLVMTVILVFRPADPQISLYRKLYHEYKTPTRLCYNDENPYHRAKVDVYFYKRKELAFVKVDSAEVIMPVKDTVTLYVTKAPELPVNKQFQPLLIYSSLPQWIKKFNFNHWIERTDFWYVYELQSK